MSRFKYSLYILLVAFLFVGSEPLTLAAYCPHGVSNIQKEQIEKDVQLTVEGLSGEYKKAFDAKGNVIEKYLREMGINEDIYPFRVEVFHTGVKGYITIISTLTDANIDSYGFNTEAYPPHPADINVEVVRRLIKVIDLYKLDVASSFDDPNIRKEIDEFRLNYKIERSDGRYFKFVGIRNVDRYMAQFHPVWWIYIGSVGYYGIEGGAESIKVKTVDWELLETPELYAEYGRFVLGSPYNIAGKRTQHYNAYLFFNIELGDSASTQDK